MNSQLQSCVVDKSIKKRILVIDDNLDILTLLQYSLEDICGWNVITANSGYEGLIKATTEQVDAIILDGIMPQMDALMFLKELRNNPQTQHLPVILLTGSVVVTQQRSLLDFNVLGTIIKPFDIFSLCEQVAKLLGWTIETSEVV